MGVISKLKTFIWFIRQPVLYPQLLYLFYQRLFPHSKENTKPIATKWCEENAISTSEALEKIAGLINVVPFEQQYHFYIEEGKRQVEKLNVKMGGGADLTLLYYLSKFLDATTIVETGVAYGWSSLAFLASFDNKVGGILFSSDLPYAKMNNEEFVGAVVPDDLKKKWNLIRLPDRQALKRIQKEVTAIDICHYDSDKSFRGRIWIYPKLWNLLRKGGIFVSDDISDNTAFKDFANQVCCQPTIVYNEMEQKYIGVLVKSS